MKIILANKFFYPRGGDCIHTIQLKELLEEKGHQVAIFSMEHPKNIDNQYSKYWPSEIIFDFGSPFKFLSVIIRPFGAKEVVKKWKKMLNDFKPDIVHLHNIHTQISPIIAKICMGKNIPVVWTLHDYKLICPSYLMLRDNRPCELCIKRQFSVVKKRCIKNNYLASLLGFFEIKKWNKEKLQNYTSVFIAPSIFLRNEMIKGGFQEKSIIHLYNFFPEEKIVPYTERDTKDFMLYVGRISKEKGVDLLLQAMEQFPDKQLKIIGDGPIRPLLEKKYANRKNVEFLGFQSWDVIQEYLGTARFLVVPSEWYENNPLTIIESLVLGTPVLGAKIGGIPELIAEGENGFCFEPGNMDDLILGINKMFLTNFDKAKIALYAKEMFSAEKYYSKIIKIYNGLIV